MKWFCISPKIGAVHHLRSLAFVMALVSGLSMFGAHAWGADTKSNATTVAKKATPTDKPWYKNLSLSLTLGTFVGTGSFAPAETYRNHYVAQSLSFSATYNIWKGLYASATWGFDVEYTQPDNDSGRRFFARDIWLLVGWKNFISPIQKHVPHRIYLNFQLPTSLLAQVSTRILRAELGLAASYSIKKIVTFGYSFGVAKDFNLYTSPIFNQQDAITPSILLRQSTRDSLSLSNGLVPLPASRNVSWQLSNSLYVSVNFHKKVAMTVSFAIFNAFKYPTPNDALTPTIPTVEGDLKADTVGRVDFTMGDINISYSPFKYLSFALGAFSLQSPFMNNNKTLRVPFFNLTTPNDNTTTFYLNMTGSY